MRLVVIGGGPGGVQAALTAAAQGVQVELVERQELGGNAVWHSLLPTKVHLHAAALQQGLAVYGGDPLAPGRALRTEAIRAEAARQAAQELEDAGVTVWRGAVRTLTPRAVEIATAEGAVARAADAVLLATGSVQHVPPGIRPDGQRVWLPRDVGLRDEVPPALLVAGAGATGLEFAYLFAVLGSRVTVVSTSARALPEEDEDVVAPLVEALRELRVEFRFGCRLAAASAQDDEVAVAFEGAKAKASFPRLLLATGRRPAHRDLGLAECGLRCTGDGFVQVDGCGRTNVPGLFAVGDATGRPLSAGKARRQAVAAVRALLNQVPEPVDAQREPVCVFTRPELARTGFTETALQAQGRPYVRYRAPWAGNWRALVDGEEAGFVKVLAAPTGRPLLGAAAVGGHAAELMAVCDLALRHGLGVAELCSLAAHEPTYASALRELRQDE